MPWVKFKFLNNQGQVLILFVILLPVLLFGIFGTIIHFSTIYEKRKLTNIAELACNYALKESSKEKVRSIVTKNDAEIEKVDIKRKNQSVNITLEKEMSILFLNKKISVKASYECRTVEGKV